jgi:hypothetical protein
MDVFDCARDMLTAAASPINKAPLIESRRQIRLGFNTGILRVGFSHTVPEPAHTVTRGGYTRTQTVNHAVLNETRSNTDTRGFYFIKSSLFHYI